MPSARGPRSSTRKRDARAGSTRGRCNAEPRLNTRRNPLPLRHPARPLSRLAVLAVLGAVLSSLLLAGASASAPARALPRAHGTACAVTRVHGAHHRGSCAGTRRTSRTHTRHASAGHGKRRHTRHTARATRPARASEVPAACEDGSAPASVTDGSFACMDGSEPTCEDGSQPVRSAAAATLVCPPSSDGESFEASEGECEEACTAAPSQCEAAATVGCEPPQAVEPGA